MCMHMCMCMCMHMYMCIHVHVHVHVHVARTCSTEARDVRVNLAPRRWPP